MQWNWLTLCGLVMLGGLSLPGRVSASSDESLTSRYFDELRQRGLFGLAESHAESRLADPLLPPPRRIEFVIELSRTLVAHAMTASDDQQPELWERAAAVLQQELAVAENAPRRVLLEFYAALVPAARVEQLVFDIEASSFEDPPREALARIAAQALQELARVEELLSKKIKTEHTRKKGGQEITAHVLRRLQSQVGVKRGSVLQAKARLSPAGSQERHSDVLDADVQFRKVLSTGGEEWQPSAEFGLAVSNRLRDDMDRALSMLEALEREQKIASPSWGDAVRLERARILLQINQPDAAAETLLQMRVGRERMPGEFWLVHLQVLSGMRRLAAQRQAKPLVAELDQRAQAALKEVDTQAGGPWSRRCRVVWAAAESVERYGQRLAAMINKAEGDYLAGRLEAAITAYAAAVDLAHEDGRQEVEMTVGYTLSAILAKAGRWDDVARRCRQLVTHAPNHPKAPEIDLLRLYALGQAYDRHRDDEHQTGYAQAITEHIRRFSNSPTVSEAEYLSGRFLETNGQHAEAAAAYGRVPPGHPRGAAAAAAIARCWVARLQLQRETAERDARLEQQAVAAVGAWMKSVPELASEWSDAHVELAYHWAKLQLLIEPPQFAYAEQWLNRLHLAAHVNPDGERPTATRQEVGRRAGPLQLIALAGQGRPHEAERLWGTLEQAGAAELLAVVEELSQIEIQQPLAANRSLVEMQLASAEALDQRRKDLSAEQQRRLDMALAKSYFVTAQPTKAVAVFQRMLDQAPKDIELAQHIAERLASREELNCRLLARACWERVEKSCKQGTVEWLKARSRVIASCLRLGEHDQARKLLKVTKLLYPQLGGDQLQRRYAELEVELK